MEINRALLLIVEFDFERYECFGGATNTSDNERVYPLLVYFIPQTLL